MEELRLRSTQEELERSRNSYFELFDLAPIGYFTVDKKDQILNLNLTASELLEKDRNEFEQMGLSHFIHPDDLGVYYSHRKNVFYTGARQTCELRMKKDNEEEFHARLDMGSIYDYEADENCLLVTVSDITELKEKERELLQLYTAVRNASDSIIMTDNEGYISYTNEATLTLFDSNPVGKNFVELFDHKDRKKAKLAISQLKEKGSITEEFYISREDNKAIESNMNTMDDNGEIIGFLIASRDISERKEAEQNLKKKLMKFKLEEGNLYLDGNLDKSIKALEELTGAGYSSLMISRTPSEDLKAKLDFDCDFLWIAEKLDGVSSLKELRNEIESLPKRKAFLLDRLDYFISKEGFKETLSFIHNLRDLTYLKDLVVILVLDPSTLDEKSFALLSKETNEIETRDIEKIPEDLLSILKFAYAQNKMGVKPSFTDICDHLNVSKPTIRKKIKTLVNKDYLIEKVEGTHKRVEVTDKTRNLFWK